MPVNSLELYNHDGWKGRNLPCQITPLVADFAASRSWLTKSSDVLEKGSLCAFDGQEEEVNFGVFRGFAAATLTSAAEFYLNELLPILGIKTDLTLKSCPNSGTARLSKKRKNVAALWLTLSAIFPCRNSSIAEAGSVLVQSANRCSRSQRAKWFAFRSLALQTTLLAAARHWRTELA